MKLQLNEQTLNAYINEAIRQELFENNTDELFGSRRRKEAARMITGQGFGNQKKTQRNFWGGPNTDISATDPNEETPQTLVGIIKKLEDNLVKLEKIAGFPGTHENLAAGVAAAKRNGRLKVKQSLLNAISALSRLADRTNAVERKTGLNTLMEGVEEGLDPLGPTGWTSQSIPATVDNVITPGPLLTPAATNAGRTGLGARLGRLGTKIGNGLKGVGSALGTAASTVGNVMSSQIGGAGATGIMATPVGWVVAIVAACLSIAQVAAAEAQKSKQRNIIRTYNCAAILAKRMAGIAKAFEKELAAAGSGATAPAGAAAPAGTGSGVVSEINVRRSRSFFESIETGMQQLSQLMQDINTKLHSVSMPASLNTPDEIKAFQEWANANGYKDERGMPLAVDGIFGRHTSYVYDQIAAATSKGTVTESIIDESRAVLRALTDLENKVGATGSGGRAYADISAMSGARDGTRMQGARAAKFIIRTYPPVLNQYLGILADAGAEVSGIQPLAVDNRPHRDYDWQEIREIDTRIQQLLAIAQKLDVGAVTLPPKPVRTPGGGGHRGGGSGEPAAPELPVLDDTIDIQDEPIDVPDEDFADLDTSVPEVNPIGYLNPKSKDQSINDRNFIDAVIDAMRGMGKDDAASLRVKRMGMRNAYNNALAALNRMVQQGTMTSAEAREERRKLRYYYNQFKRGGRDAMWESKEPVKLDENAFKNLVKQTIRESLRG